MKSLSIPVGVSDFAEIRQNGYYYVDKTALIGELLKTTATKVTLITRPRRFGKTLAMSMLDTFFDIRKNSRALFEGLTITKDQGLCEKWMNQWPTVFVSFRQVDGLNFSAACGMLNLAIANLYKQHLYLLDSNEISIYDKESMKRILNGNATVTELKGSLLLLTGMLRVYYGKPVILLIDEYDVPLDKAFQNSYYEEMVSLIRNMFGNVLKTNSNLYFAVLTGCLRIAKESIFTGLNNFEVLSVLDVQYDEYFGFTDTEVQDMLNYYDLSGHYTEVKEWYDGYQFGNTEVYCPWDVICYCKKLYADPNTKPEDYWSNTSGNAIVRRFINRADSQTKNDIERLIAGETVTKEIHQELTYNELDSSIENLWNVLFTTGYLTQKGKTAENQFRLKIPNLGVKNLFIKQIREWFRQTSRQDGDTLNQFCNAFSEQNPAPATVTF